MWIALKDGVRGFQTNSFYFRTVKIWNELPKEVVHATDVSNFKEKLDNAWNELQIKCYELSDS